MTAAKHEPDEDKRGGVAIEINRCATTSAMIANPVARRYDSLLGLIIPIIRTSFGTADAGPTLAKVERKK